MIKRKLIFVTALAIGLIVAGCGERKEVLKVGAKPFTESMVLAEMIAQLAENAGIPVERHIPFGPTNQVMEATKQGIIDVYPEYNGTALIFLGQAPTSDGERSTETVQRLFNPLGVQMAGKFGFSNDYAIVTTKEWAEQHGVTKISDLSNISEPLNFAVDTDFTQRPADGLPQMLRRYGLTANSTVDFPWSDEAKDQIVSRLLDGSSNVAELFVTDAQIAEYDLLILEDDLKFFPLYEVAPLVRSDALQSIPELAGVLSSLEGAIDASSMQQMNKSVELDAQSPASVATVYLASNGLLPEGAAVAAVESLSVVGDPGVMRGSETARALRAIRAGFQGMDIELVNSDDPLATLSNGEARVAMAGTESFYSMGESGPVAKDNAVAFAVLGHKTGHLFALSGGPGDISGMSRIATGQAGTGSALVLEMIMTSFGLNVEIVNEEKSLGEQLEGLRNGDYDGVFAMLSQGDRNAESAMQAGGLMLVGMDEWSEGGHTAQYSFIRPTTIAANTYSSQSGAVSGVSTQYVLASPVEPQHETGDVGPGTANIAQAIPVSAGAVNSIRDALGGSEIVDPAVPVHAALLTTIEVIDKSLPFSLDISIINILIIVFVVWIIYACFLPSPRTLTMPEDDDSSS